MKGGRPDYARTIPCDCQLHAIEQRRRAFLLSKCELPENTEGLTFETFDAVDGTVEALAALKSLAEGSELLWVTLISPPDRGKTHLALATCREWLKRGEPAYYAYVPLLLHDLRRGFGREGDNSYDARFDFFCNIPLLVLDDLGVESDTAWVNEHLDTIVDYRAVRRLPLIITSNLSKDELPPRIRSRVQRVPFGKVVTITAGEYHKHGGKQ